MSHNESWAEEDEGLRTVAAGGLRRPMQLPFKHPPSSRAPLRFGFTAAGARRHHPQLPGGPGIHCSAPP